MVGPLLLGTPLGGLLLLLLVIAVVRVVRRRRSAVDGPAWLVDVAARRLPEGREDWGEAMAAELSQLDSRRARWGFAVGCVRTALFPPRPSGPPALAVALVGAVVALIAGLALGATPGPVRVFAVALIATMTAMVTWNVLRARRPDREPGAAAGGPGRDPGGRIGRSAG